MLKRGETHIGSLQACFKKRVKLLRLARLRGSLLALVTYNNANILSTSHLKEKGERNECR